MRTTNPAIRVLLLFCALGWLVHSTTGVLRAAESPVTVADPRSASTQTVVLVAGAPAEPEYATNFTQQAVAWRTACAKAGARLFEIGTTITATNSAGEGDREALKKCLSTVEPSGPEPLWLVLIGHGTFDGKSAKFNLRGADLTPADLSEWLKPIQRPLVLIDTSSSSGPFLPLLSATNRVVITATRSGSEINFARFGGYLAGALGSAEADLDQDGQVSALEVFLSAAHRVDEFYRMEGRLVTEHALIDDNGDKLGTPATWFRGVRAIKKAKDGASIDGVRAHQLHLIRGAEELAMSVEARARRDSVETAIARLRDQKATLSEDEYYARLERLLLDLAGVGRAPKPQQ